MGRISRWPGVTGFASGSETAAVRLPRASPKRSISAHKGHVIGHLPCPVILPHSDGPTEGDRLEWKDQEDPCKPARHPQQQAGGCVGSSASRQDEQRKLPRQRDRHRRSRQGRLFARAAALLWGAGLDRDAGPRSVAGGRRRDASVLIWPTGLRCSPYSGPVGCSLCGHRKDPLFVRAARGGAIVVDRSPMCPGHLLVVTLDHVSSSEDLGREERAAFLRMVEEARDIAARIGGRPAIAIEHGRSPTCGDRSCSCHAHVHVVPVGDLDEQELFEKDLVRESREPTGYGSYLAVSAASGKWRRFSLTRPVPHAARLIATVAAASNGVAWRPMMALPDGTAQQTLRVARQGLQAPRAEGERGTRCLTKKPVVVVSGSTGSGKTTVGAHLARHLKVPAIELGVVLRLASLQREHETRAAGRLWRWSMKGRLDFHGLSRHQLAAAVPRIDGGTYELPMWTEVEAARLAAMARRSDIQEVLTAIVERVVQEAGGAVVVGRVPPDLSSGLASRSLALAATPYERSRRKRMQLTRIGMTAAEHDWFDPRSSFATSVENSTLDTTSMSLETMCAMALTAASDEPAPERARAS
ncbi:MAG TPA: HIT domain-containing protein [Solirubrobacterales bacterium]|nr:HIT domain-containing protein [Solirubrobacterales bacterium]